jgi:hypothetical protein
MHRRSAGNLTQSTIMHLHALALAAWLAPACAVFFDDAYHNDFHYALLGLPKHEATFFQKPYAASKASLLYTVSENGTIGAINPKDGALVWRSASGLSGNGHLRGGEEQDTVIGAVGDRITAWSSSDGRVVWESRADGAVVEDLEILEQEDGMTDNDAKDALVLLADSSPSVKRLDGKTGRTKWTFTDNRCAERNAVWRTLADMGTAATRPSRSRPRPQPSTTFRCIRRYSEAAPSYASRP